MMSPKHQAKELSSFFEEQITEASEQARKEGQREALSDFLKALNDLSNEVMARIAREEAVLGEEVEDLEEEEEEEEEETLSQRALAALDLLMDRKRLTVKDLENHLGCSNAAANLALNELTRKNRATKTFENGRAVFRLPSASAKAA